MFDQGHKLNVLVFYQIELIKLDNIFLNMKYPK